MMLLLINIPCFPFSAFTSTKAPPQKNHILIFEEFVEQKHLFKMKTSEPLSYNRLITFPNRSNNTIFKLLFTHNYFYK